MTPLASDAAAKIAPPDRNRDDASRRSSELSNDKLEALLGRLRIGRARPPRRSPWPAAAAAVFLPPEPPSLKDIGISEIEVSALVLKFLLKSGGAAGGHVATQLRLPYHMAQAILAQLKTDQRIVYKNSTEAGDFFCELTKAGAEYARRAHEHCSYCGSVPVPLSDYIAGVEAQSLTLQCPELDDVSRALADLCVSPKLTSRIAQAVRAGRGMFLYGAAGNGKSSVAERITGAFGQQVWIPRTVSIDGEILKLYDPCCHDEIPFDAKEEPPKLDWRWIRIRRPTVVAGGELSMDRLEATLNKLTGICEAPIQMKSNCGTLVIDDFGRQRMAVSELLNRWIVPLEKRFDYINLPSGRAVRIPFDQLIVFSTNLEPRSLVDKAFLRRIPYKIEFQDPTEGEFRGLLAASAAAFGISPDEDAFDDLIERHYRAASGRSGFAIRATS